MDLILIRHPAVNVATGTCYGRTDVPLLDDVTESTRALHERMIALNVPPIGDALWTSPLSRCKKLADTLADKLGKPIIDTRLQELDFGAWEGQPWDGLDRALIDAWAADIDHSRAHGGESVAQFAARVIEWREALDNTQRVVHAVTHAGVMRVLSAHLLGVSRANAIQWPLDFGAIVWLRRVRDEWLLVRWNA